MSRGLTCCCSRLFNCLLPFPLEVLVLMVAAVNRHQTVSPVLKLADTFLRSCVWFQFGFQLCSDCGAARTAARAIARLTGLLANLTVPTPATSCYSYNQSSLHRPQLTITIRSDSTVRFPLVICCPLWCWRYL